jgi:DNA-binding transcriptional ArsR family regulator
MNLQRPLQVVGPTLDGDVLTALARADRPMTGRMVEQAIAGSHGGVQRALEHLVAEGVITSERVGRANLYRLNREHIAAPWIEGLASLRLQLIQRLRDSVAGWRTQPDALVLFGSAARGDAGRDSDIDLLVVRPSAVEYDDATWRDQVEELRSRTAAWTGNDARVLEYSVDEVSDEPVVATAADEGIEIAGTLRRLLRER